MKKNVIKNSKRIGQIFTPDYIVISILDYCGYSGDDILEKHIVDNSCGDGAFLREIVRRYILESLKNNIELGVIREKLGKYIHGIDNDKVAFDSCVENLNRIASEYGIENVKWDLYNTSSLTFNSFNEKMDFVVGNPPYIRVHNLDSIYAEVKTYMFANGGMTDIYLAFFELGFRMLKEDGVLCYITPISWLNSLAADNMRKYILQHKCLVALIDLGHFQAFEKATAYTMISQFKKSHKSEYFDYYVYDGNTYERIFVEQLSLSDIYIDSYFYLSDKKNLDKIRKIKEQKTIKYISVKNGFATLADNVFIGKDIPDSPITINVVKASTGKWNKCIFPYNKFGKPLTEEEIFSYEEIGNHFLSNKEKLLKGKEEYPGWYLFGRTQALADVYRPKLSLNSLVRNEKDFKFIELKSGEGIYSGLYIITDYGISMTEIKDVIATPEFIEYVKILKKYKSGGYYTFNSKDVEQYVNYCFSQKNL